MEEILDPVSMLFGHSIQYAQNGAKLGDVEVADEPSVIPEGTYHKNKHADFDLDTTKKGIPVGHLTVSDEGIETLEDIKNSGSEFIQDAEIENNEIIFSKELTDFLEDKRKEWNDSKDSSILLEVGKRLTKEILENTNDNTGLIDKLK